MQKLVRGLREEFNNSSIINMIKIISLSNQLFQQKLDDIRNGIQYGLQMSEIIARHLLLRPFHLNVIEAACHGRFKETGHSLVLADMLRHPAIQDSFLETFLNIKHEFMEVTAETDRVDVALRGNDIFIIVENKVNAAEEKKNQVYRYVHEIGVEKYGYSLSQIYVVYLNPTNRNLPSDYSLCDENKEHNVFDELGDEHYTVQSYKYDITNWLRELSINDEPHINSALDQYIDFLENKFHTSPLDKNMNNEIKNLLLKELQIEDKPLEEQIAALSNQYGKTEELLRAIESLKIEMRKELSLKMIREWQKQIEQKLGITLSEDSHSFGIQLRNKVWLGIWDGHDSQDHLPYWGFQFNSFRKGSMPKLYEQIETLLLNLGLTQFHSEKDWIAWCTTKKGVERFMSLYHGVKEMGLL